MGNLRILVADDHTLFRQGLRRVLEEQRGWEVVAEAADGAEAVRSALELEPQVVILDIAMPRLNGVEATRQIARRLPAARILILTMYADELYVTQGLQAGAHGFMLKDSADADLVRFAPDEEFTVDVGRLHHRNPVSAYAGRRLAGVVRETWLRGVPIRFDTEDTPRGRLLRRGER